MKRLAAPLAAILGLAVLIGLSPAHATSADLDSFYQQRLTWSPCEFGGAECARLRVPLDYAHPGRGEISLLVERVRSTAARPLGSLVVNPGGPGAAGASFAQYGGYLLGSVASRYDFVGFDPRGVGRSRPINCMSDRLTDEFLGADASPDSAGELADYARLSKRVADSCRLHAPALYSHIGTYDTARDMDVLRAALGDSRLNYIGLSYGTRLGAVYADLFPARVGRMILDGAVNPANTAVELVSGQSGGFNDALRQFVAHCVDHGCSIGDSRRQVIRRINGLLADLDSHPIPVGRRVLTQPLALNGMLGSLYSHDYGWPSLESAISAALRGDGEPLLSAVDSFFGRSGDGSYATNMMSALNAISCWDGARTQGPAALLALSRAQARTSTFPEITLQLIMSALTCHYWPGVDDESPQPVAGPANSPILVIGTRHDPATPWIWARQLAGQLRSGVLLTWEGNGHTATGRGSSCIRRWESRYLATGTPPPSGTVCA